MITKTTIVFYQASVPCPAHIWAGNCFVEFEENYEEYKDRYSDVEYDGRNIILPWVESKAMAERMELDLKIKLEELIGE